MDFIIGLPRVQSAYNVLWVIINTLTNTSHFLLIKNIISTDQLGKFYVKEIVRLHGVPKTIVLDGDTRFVLHVMIST